MKYGRTEADVNAHFAIFINSIFNFHYLWHYIDWR